MLDPLIVYQILGVVTYQSLNFTFIISCGLDQSYKNYALSFFVLQVVVITIIFFINKKYPSYLKPSEYQSRQAEEFLEMKFMTDNRKSNIFNDSQGLFKRVKSIHEQIPEGELNQFDLSYPEQ